jgi:uncharacterized membrane protein (GlpM family)
MGLVIKAALGRAGVTDWHSGKNEKLLYCRADPLFPTFALIAHYIVASERGTEALRATIVFGMWSIIPYFLYLLSLWYFTGFLRLPGAGRGGRVLEPQRLGVDLFLEPFPLAQWASTVHREGSAGDVAAGEQVIDKIDHLFFAGSDFHQRFVQRLLAILSVIILVK